MTDPRRLIQDGTDFERSILRSARLDVASDPSAKRALVAVGAGAATISAAASTAGAGVTAAGSVGVAAGGSAGAAGGTTWLGGVGTAGFVKWVGVAIAVVGAGGAVTGSAGRWQAPTRAQAAIHVAAPAPPAPVEERPPADRPISAATEIASSTLPADSVDPVEPVPAPTALRHAVERSAPPAAAIEPDAAPSLEAQVAALDDVRTALAGGDPARALAELDAYDRGFPGTAFAEEAAVLRADSLVKKGDRSTAEEVARRFLALHPASPHASHLRELVNAPNL